LGAISPAQAVDQTTAPSQADQFAAGVLLREVWESRFGAMLIEVKGERAYVNGQAVEPVEPAMPLTSTR
jgi:hypothetical protein